MKTIIKTINLRMAGSALKRLMAEHRQLMKNPPEGIVAGPKSDDNYFEWEANILGPPDTCFEFGVFKASLTFPKDYPMSPPKMKFLSDICHPNVYADGELFSSETFQNFIQDVSVFRFFIHQAMIRWDMNLQRKDGVLFKMWKKFYFL